MGGAVDIGVEVAATEAQLADRVVAKDAGEALAENTLDFVFLGVAHLVGVGLDCALEVIEDEQKIAKDGFFHSVGLGVDCGDFGVVIADKGFCKSF